MSQTVLPCSDMQYPWPSASSSKGNPPALGKHVPKAGINHINIHVYSLWNSVSLQTSVQSGEQSGQKSKQAGKNTTFFFNVTEPRRHQLPLQILLSNTNREDCSKFTLHFRKYLLILFSLVMFFNRRSWTVISYSHFHGSQFTLSLTQRQTLSYLPSAWIILEEAVFFLTLVF